MSKRAHTNPLAVPEPIEYDDTPLPVEPTPPDAIAGFETLSPAARAQFESLHIAMKERDVTIARLHENRHVGDVVDELRSAIGGLGNLLSVPELLRVQGNRMAEILNWRQNTADAVVKLTAVAERLDDRLDSAEKTFIEIKAQITALSTHIGTVAATLTTRIDGAEARLEKLAHRIDSEIAALALRADASTSALALRVVSLEKDRTIVKAWAILIGFLLGLAAAWAKIYTSSGK